MDASMSNKTPDTAELWPITDDSIRDVFLSMLQDGSWGRYHGPHCDRLQSALRDLHQVEHAVLCGSGTAAVELALRSVPVGPRDEVILSAYDFKANFSNVLTVGAVPVLIDVVPGRPVIDIRLLEQACSDRTKAILVSHLHGCLAPVCEIREFANARGIAVIEDACQSPGAIVDGRRAGTVGDIGVLSFGGSKLLTAGRGGALLTSQTSMAQRIKLYTQRGNEAYPLSEMQAAVLLPQVHQLDAQNATRRQRASQWLQGLADVTGFQSAICPDASNSAEQSPAFYKMAFVLTLPFRNADRQTICESARAAGIPLDAGFSALHLIHSQRRFRAAVDLPNAAALHDRMTTLHHTALMQSESATTAMISKLTAILHRG